MLQANSVLDLQAIQADGSIQLRFLKQVMNGDVPVASEPHRALLTPGCDVDAALAAVSAHLEQMGYPALSASDIAKIKATADLAQTPDVIAAYRAAQAA